MAQPDSAEGVTSAGRAPLSKGLIPFEIMNDMEIDMTAESLTAFSRVAKLSRSLEEGGGQVSAPGRPKVIGDIFLAERWTTQSPHCARRWRAAGYRRAAHGAVMRVGPAEPVDRRGGAAWWPAAARLGWPDGPAPAAAAQSVYERRCGSAAVCPRPVTRPSVDDQWGRTVRVECASRGDPSRDTSRD